MTRVIYLDHNATTPVLPEVREAMLPFLGDEWGNPSSSYRFGSKLKSTIESARESVAELLGAASPREILFTASGTESNNTAIPGAEVNGHATQRLANTTNLHFPGIESEALLLLLDQAGICASSGSACLADSPDPSHVIAAMKPGDAARQSVRFSLGAGLTSADIAAIIAAAGSIIPPLRTLIP